MEEEKTKELAGQMVEPLLDWFAENARKLPWRDDPKPYYVWISEIMLQQTRVEAVRGYFRRFIAELPDIKALAEADDERLLKLWEGLGYYSRVKNLKKAAAAVMEKYDGQLPSAPEELRKLPGIGSYTAGAVASIAFGKKAAAVDGNVLRVMMRLWGSRIDISKDAVKKQVGSCLESVMPKQYAGAFNQALMELGAIVCLPNGRPLCGECPVREICSANREGLQEELPVKPAKKPRKIEEKTILVLETDEGILVRKRAEKGLLAGLWEYPHFEGKQSEEYVRSRLGAAGLTAACIRALGEAKHIFSHIEWRMTGYYIRLAHRAGLSEAAGKAAEEEAQYAETADAGRGSTGRAETLGRSGSTDGETQAAGRSGGTGRAEIFGQCEAALKGCIPVHPRKLREEYSMPAAFDAYQILLRHKNQPDEEV